MTLDKKMIDCATPLNNSTLIQSFIKSGTSIFGRYLNPGWKGITLAEKNLIIANGGKIVSIYESYGNYVSYFNQERGQLDAQAAVSYAKSLGQPSGTPIFFAVDCETSTVADMDCIRAYFQGVYDEIGDYKVGVYGSAFTCNNVKADFYWQTFAWSNGQISSRATIYQYTNDVKEQGIGVDDDKIASGYWPVDVIPQPVHVALPVLQLTTPYTQGQAVRELQNALTSHNFPCMADGVFGRGTQNTVMAFQKAHGLIADGIVGPKTWGALGL